MLAARRVVALLRGGALAALLGALAACGGASSASSVTIATDEALSQLAPCERWAAVAIEPRTVRITGRGTRSQSMALSARVLASANAEVRGPLGTAQYVGGERFMEPGRCYVALLCGVGDAWQVVSWDRASRSRARETVDAAAEAVQRRLAAR